MIDETPWWHLAECRGMGPDLFFPAQGDNDGAERAKAVCRRCRVARECLEDSLAAGVNHGVWGAAGEADRRRIRSARHRERAKDQAG